jgi:antitoxin (DNA-binding transcriptional repressor) of toxin-antitoxin stability system
MPTVNIYEAKTQLSRLLAAVDSGEEVVIARRGEPRWRLSLIDDEIPARIPARGLSGRLRGRPERRTR